METLESIRTNFQLSGVTLERMVMVGGDLEYLIDSAGADLPSHTAVRLQAAVLRRLLIDNQLGQVWQSMGMPRDFAPAVEAVDIDRLLSAWPAEWVWHAWAGGATARAAAHQGFIMSRIPRDVHERYGSPDAFFDAHPFPMLGDRRAMGVSEWLRSTAVAIQTDEMGLVRISRSALLKYIANRKGGVHFDPSRKPHLKNHKKRRREVEAQLLDYAIVRVGHLDGPEYEVASMVHAVAVSDWAREIVRIARDAAPDWFQGDPTEMRCWTGQVEADGTRWATFRFASNFADAATSRASAVDPPPDPGDRGGGEGADAPRG